MKGRIDKISNRLKIVKEMLYCGVHDSSMEN